MRLITISGCLVALLGACAPLDASSGADALVLGNDVSGVGPHLELPEVVATRDFCTPLSIPGVDASAIALVPGQRIGALISWDAAHGCFAGRLRAAGAYRFEISAAGARQLVHLVAQPLAGAADELRDYAGIGPYAVGDATRTVSFGAPIDGAPSTSMRVHYPATLAGSGAPVAPGAYPLLVVALGNSYLASDYDEIGARIASWGIVFAVPDVPNGASMLTVGRRVAYVREAIAHLRNAGASASDPLAGHVSDGLAIAGHSWGGAAADLAMRDGEASLYVLIDPVSLIHDPNDADSTYHGLSGRGPYVRPVPTLILDATLSAYGIAGAAYAGYYTGPSIHVGLGAAFHESFLDHDAAPNASHPVALTDAVHAAATHYIVAAMARYVHADVGAGGALFGSNNGLASYPHAITVAARRPTSSDLVVDDFADAALTTDALGGSIVVTGASASLAEPLAAEPWATVFAAQAFFDASAFRALRLSSLSTAQLRFSEAHALDVRDQRVIAFDLARTSAGTPTVARIGLGSGVGTQWVTATGSFSDAEHPGTVSVPLSSFGTVDLGAIRHVDLEITGPVTATIDALRFVR